MNGSTQELQSRDRLWDTTFGWFLVQYFLWNVGQGAFTPLLPKVMEDLGLTFASSGLLGSGFALARFLVDLPAGVLAERLGVSCLVHGASGLLLLGGLLAAVAGSFEAMLAAQFLAGIGSGMANILAVLYLMRRSAPRQVNRRANMYELAVIAGMAASAFAAGEVATRWHWRASFGLAAGVQTVTWIVAARGVLPGLRGMLLEESRSPASPPIQVPPRASWGPMAAVFVATFAQAFAWGGGISTLFPLYGGSALGLSSAAIGQSLAVAFWIEVCLLVPVGWAADVWGKARIMVPGFGAMLLGTILGPLASGVLGFGVAYVLLNVGMSVWMLVPALLAEQARGAFGGRAAAKYRLVTDLGFIVAPATVGWMIGGWGFTAAALPIVGVLVISILLSLRFLRSPWTV